MQKQKKQLIGVIVVLILCLGAYFALTRYNAAQEEKETKEKEAETIQVTDLDKENITAFSYQSDGSTLSFTKDGDGNWTYDGDTSIDIDESSISTMLANVVNITAEEKLDETEDSADYGFDAPTQVITITIGEQTTTLTLGSQNAINKNYYLKTSDSDTIYLVGSTLSSAFTKTVDDLTVKAEDDSSTDTSTDSSAN